MNITEKRQIIQPGETIIERGQSSFFYCNKASAPFKLRLSDGSSLIMSSRRRIKLNEPLDIFCLENDTDQPIEVSYTMGFGDFTDDSLYIEGTIQTNPIPYNSFITQTLTFGEDGVLTIPAAQKVIIQNIGPQLVLIGDNGLHLQVLGSFECSFNAELKVHGYSGSQIVVGSFN